MPRILASGSEPLGTNLDFATHWPYDLDKSFTFSESFSLCIEWCGIITSIRIVSESHTRDCVGKLFFSVKHFTASITIHGSPPCPLPRALMERCWVPWTFSRLFSLFHYKIPFQVLSDLLSPTSARILLVKDALNPLPAFKASEEAVCYHANWESAQLFMSSVSELPLVPI